MAHAILSPSSAERWIHCPPSAVINAEAPRTDTVYTREGTLAHAICELKGRRTFLLKDMLDADAYNAELKKLGREDIMVVVGGVIPPQDYDFLYKAGAAAIFGPGTVISDSATIMLNLLLGKE